MRDRFLDQAIESLMVEDAAELVGELVSWKWYCRVDGAEGTHYTEQGRNQTALRHRDHECAGRAGRHACWEEVGQLVHVWRY